MSELTETQNIDQTDQLSSFRKLFLYPQGKNLLLRQLTRAATKKRKGFYRKRDEKMG
jgi:hypothetical protein